MLHPGIDYHSQEAPAVTVVNVEEVTSQEALDTETAKVETARSEGVVNTSSPTAEEVQASTAINIVLEDNDESVASFNEDETPVQADVLESDRLVDADSEPLQDEGQLDEESTPSNDAGSVADAPADRKAKEEEPQEMDEAKPTQSQVANFNHPAKQIITPNGDSYNDYLLIEGYGVKEFYLVIMAQNGQPVFESRDPSVKWNGTDRMGNALPAGQYFYKIVAVGNDDLPYVAPNAKGSVQIIR